MSGNRYPERHLHGERLIEAIERAMQQQDRAQDEADTWEREKERLLEQAFNEGLLEPIDPVVAG